MSDAEKSAYLAEQELGLRPSPYKHDYYFKITLWSIRLFMWLMGVASALVFFASRPQPAFVLAFFTITLAMASLDFILRLLVNVEQNTSRSAHLLEKIVTSQRSRQK